MSEENTPIRPLHGDLLAEFQKVFDAKQQESGKGFVEQLCHELIEDASRLAASDIHLDPGLDDYVLRLRVHGALLDVRRMEKAWADRIMNHFKVMAKLDPVPARKPMEGWVEYEHESRVLNFRVSCIPTVSGDKLSIRLLDASRMLSDLSELGVTEEQSETIRSWVKDIQGMFLVVGATGSGKTTTVYALLHELRERARSIVTIEDPVEFQIEGLTQMQIDRDTDFDFAGALRSVLRLDPDYIMVGELRGEASTKAALDAASSGKILFGTLHSRDAAGAVTTLRNYGLRDHEIAAVLEMVVAQRLVRTLCPKCKKKGPVDPADRDWAAAAGWELPDEIWYPEGCEHCQGMGYDGRTGIFEVWRLGSAAKSLLLKGEDEFAIRTAMKEAEQTQLRDGARRMVTAGETSLEEVRMTGGFGPAD